MQKRQHLHVFCQKICERRSCLVLSFIPAEHWDTEDHMQHAGGAGGRAGVPKWRVAGEGKAVGGLERCPGRRKKPGGKTHKRPAEAVGQRETEQVTHKHVNINICKCIRTQEGLHHAVLIYIAQVRLVIVLNTGCVLTSAAPSLARQWNWQSKSTRLRSWPYSRPWRSRGWRLRVCLILWVTCANVSNFFTHWQKMFCKQWCQPYAAQASWVSSY